MKKWQKACLSSLKTGTVYMIWKPVEVEVDGKKHVLQKGSLVEYVGKSWFFYVFKSYFLRASGVRKYLIKLSWKRTIKYINFT